MILYSQVIALTSSRALLYFSNKGVLLQANSITGQNLHKILVFLKTSWAPGTRERAILLLIFILHDNCSLR